MAQSGKAAPARNAPRGMSDKMFGIVTYVMLGAMMLAVIYPLY